jgi:hypothetical protein
VFWLKDVCGNLVDLFVVIEGEEKFEGLVEGKSSSPENGILDET